MFLVSTFLPIYFILAVCGIIKLKLSPDEVMWLLPKPQSPQRGDGSVSGGVWGAAGALRIGGGGRGLGSGKGTSFLFSPAAQRSLVSTGLVSVSLGPLLSPGILRLVRWLLSSLLRAPCFVHSSRLPQFLRVSVGLGKLYSGQLQVRTPLPILAPQAPQGCGWQDLTLPFGVCGSGRLDGT